MTQLPTKFLEWLKASAGSGPILLDGYIKSATFHSLDQIRQIDLFVSVDEYISNYSDDQKHLAGNYYPVPAYDLLREVWGYEPVGVLVWLPLLSQFGSFDNDHGVLRSFPEAKWPDMLGSLGKHVYCQWYPDRVANELIRPWNDERFDGRIPTNSPPW